MEDVEQALEEFRGVAGQRDGLGHWFPAFYLSTIGD